jgi:hypothetical protein
MVPNVLTLLQVTYIRVSVNKDRLMHEYIPGCYLAKGRCDHLKVPFHTNIQVGHIARGQLVGWTGNTKENIET